MVSTIQKNEVQIEVTRVTSGTLKTTGTPEVGMAAMQGPTECPQQHCHPQQLPNS
jgi:hypothetical protein